MAKGEFIARIDSDDIWLPEKLKYQLNRFQNNPALFLLGTSVLLIDENGDPLSVQNGFNNRRHLNYKEIKRKLLRNNLFCHSSVMFRKELLNIIGHYNPKFKNSEDYEYWIRAVKKVYCEISKQVLVSYRVWSQAVSIKRREEQIYFSLKARLKGFFSTGNVITNSFYLIKFLLNSAIYLLKKFVQKLTSIREDN
jgi:glycosyltransferase involved in cell wall biosynthesis